MRGWRWFLIMCGLTSLIGPTAFSAPADEAPQFLERELLSFPTDGSFVFTSLPLELYKRYDVTIRTPYSLNPLRSSDGWWIKFDGLYWYESDSARWEMTRDGPDITVVTFRIRGTGRPLLLNTGRDVSTRIPVAFAEVARYIPPPPPLIIPLPDPPGPSTADADLLPGVLRLAGIAGGITLAILWTVALVAAFSARRRHRAELLRAQREELLARHAAEEERCREEEIEEAQQRQRDSEEAERRRQRKVEEAEVQRQRELHARARALAQVAHLERDFGNTEHRQRYAAKHRHELLGDLKQKWFSAYQLIRDDEELKQLLPQYDAQYDTNTLQWLEDKLEVIREADRQDIIPPPPTLPKAKPALHDIEQGILRFRQRKLHRQQVKVDDVRATIVQHIESRKAFEQDLIERGVDQDEIERHLAAYDRAFLEASAAEEGKSDGQKTQQHDNDDEEILRPE